MATYNFTYAAVLDSEEKMLSDLAAILAEQLITNPLRYEFMLVISEAFTNALLHGNKLNPDKNIYLMVDINTNRLSADIIDEGESGLKQIQTKKPSELYNENGRGVDLINHYSTFAEFGVTENGGTKVSVSIERKLEKIN